MNKKFDKSFKTMYESSVLYPGEVHMPVEFLIDTSGSMGSDGKNRPIQQINKYFQSIHERFKDYPEIDTIDVAVVGFNSRAITIRNFNPLSRKNHIELLPDGCSAMGQGIMLSLDNVREERCFYQENGIRFYKPWIIMLTDGSSSDDITVAKKFILEDQNKNKLRFIAAGITGCDRNQLSELTKMSLFIDLTQVSLDIFFDWVTKVVIESMHVRGMEGKNMIINLPDGVEEIF